MKLPEVNDDDWKHLDLYMSMPIEADERLELMNDLRNTVKNDMDRQFVLNALELLFMADGVYSDREEETILQIKQVLGIKDNEA